MSDRNVAISMDLAWAYASGAAMERFCRSLADRRIEGLQCDRCRRRYLPPRPVCGNCMVEMTTWVPIADTGTLEAWTIVHVPILDARTGEQRPSPYAMGLIKLQGADTTLNHFLADADPDELDIGLDVRAVWRDDVRGTIDDILCFEVVP